MIIITDSQYRSSVSMLHTLSLTGEPIVMCAEEGTNPPSFYSKYCAMARFMPKDEEEYAQELSHLCRYMMRTEKPSGSVTKPVVVPIGAKTVSLLSKRRAELSESADFIVPDEKILALANDKRRVLECADSIGIRTPKSVPVDESGAPPEYFYGYPLYVKPVFGEGLGLRAHERYSIAYDEESLREAYNHFRLLTGDAPLVEEYAGNIGVGVSVVMDLNCEPVAVFCHRRIREYPVSGGPSSFCMSFYNEKLVKKSVELLKAIGFTGIAMLEYRGDPERGFSLLEINPRVWGSFPLSVKAGSHFMEEYVRAARREPSKKVDSDYQRGVLMRFLANDMAACFDYIKSGSVFTGVTGLLSLFDPDIRDGIFSFDDKEPFHAYIKNCLKLKRLLKDSEKNSLKSETLRALTDNITDADDKNTII